MPGGNTTTVASALVGGAEARRLEARRWRRSGWSFVAFDFENVACDRAGAIVTRTTLVGALAAEILTGAAETTHEVVVPAEIAFRIRDAFDDAPAAQTDCLGISGCCGTLTVA